MVHSLRKTLFSPTLLTPSQRKGSGASSHVAACRRWVAPALPVLGVVLLPAGQHAAVDGGHVGGHPRLRKSLGMTPQAGGPKGVPVDLAANHPADRRGQLPGSPARTRRPSRPSRTASGIPSTAAATTGRPADIASRKHHWQPLAEEAGQHEQIHVRQLAVDVPLEADPVDRLGQAELPAKLLDREAVLRRFEVADGAKPDGHSLRPQQGQGVQQDLDPLPRPKQRHHAQGPGRCRRVARGYRTAMRARRWG